MYDVLMSEYGIPFDHIEEHWTDRQLAAVMKAMRKRYEKASGKNTKRYASPEAFVANVPGGRIRKAGEV